MDEGQCVRITVTGESAEGERVSLTTRGMLHDLSAGWMLRYEEVDSDDTVSLTLVQCEEDRVTITRTGTLLSTIVFDQEETFLGEYVTPAGGFQLRVFTSEVRVQRRGLIGHIRLVYQISLSTAFTPDQEMATRHLDIRFAPCRKA